MATTLTVAQKVRNDLDRLDNDLRWAFTDGHWPERKGDRRNANRPPVELGPDATEQERQRASDTAWSRRTHDTGIANDDRRAAYHQAITHLAAAEETAARALVHAGILQPAIVRPAGTDAISRIGIAIRRLKIRLVRLDTATQLDTMVAIADIAHHVDQAVRILDKAFTRGPADGIAIDPECRNAKRGCPGRATGGRSRCWRCETYWKNDPQHQEIPTAMLKERLDEPKAAQTRRIERGEGWGDA